MVGALPPTYLLLLYSDEIFEDLKTYNRRLRGYTLTKDFDIIRKEGGTKANSSCKFRYIYYNIIT
jgi:hypothetical protein